MPRKSKFTKKGRSFLSKHITKHIHKLHMPVPQAVAAAYSEARRKGYKGTGRR